MISGIKKYALFAVLLMFCLPILCQPPTLEVGDFLFQDLDCGNLCSAIDQVTVGYHQSRLSHVAMVVKKKGDQIWLIEANVPQVSLIRLADFLARSHDAEQQPRVLVARLKPPLSLLIPEALMLAPLFLGHPYNQDFHPNAYSQYCSQLLVTLFKWANHGVSIFASAPMSFHLDGGTAIHPVWAEYFHHIQRPVPEGLLGTNPGMLSLSHHLIIIGQFGILHQAHVEK